MNASGQQGQGKSGLLLLLLAVCKPVEAAVLLTLAKHTK